MTLVSRSRPIRHPMIKCGLSMIEAHDPPKYTRQQIAGKARVLLAKLRPIDTREHRNEFVRFMVKWWGEEY